MELDIDSLCSALNILVKPSDKGECLEEVGNLNYPCLQERPNMCRLEILYDSHCVSQNRLVVCSPPVVCLQDVFCCLFKLPVSEILKIACIKRLID
jgi:hypothetical protein